MRRFTSVLSLFVLPVFLSILFMPRAAACPVQEPVPLRGLYLNSDVVVVGKIGTPEKWVIDTESADPDNHYRIYARNIPVKVDEVIKGAGDNVIPVRETRYQWLGNVNDENYRRAVETGEIDNSDTGLTVNKERRLFFLHKDDEAGHYTEGYRGRELAPTQKELDVYIPRLRELANIYNSGAPVKERIIEWLVTMAEDPITRFEGAYELQRALSQFTIAEEADEYEEEIEAKEAAEQAEAEAAENAEKTGDGEANTDAAAKAETPENGEIKNDEADSSSIEIPENKVDSVLTYSPYGNYDEFVGLLTPDQKERIVRAALNVRFNYEPVKNAEAEKSDGEKGDAEESDAEEGDELDESEQYVAVLAEADKILLQAAGYLHDRRVADRLLAELPNIAKHDPSEAADMMDIIAQYFGDKKLNDLVDKYIDVSWNEDDEMIQDDDRAYDQPEEESGKAPKPAVPDDVPNSKTAPKVLQPQKSYGQRRAELFTEIIIRCNSLVVTPKKGRWN